MGSWFGSWLKKKYPFTPIKLKLKSKFNEDFVDISDVMAWASRGKNIEAALDKQNMDYIEGDVKCPI